MFQIGRIHKNKNLNIIRRKFFANFPSGKAVNDRYLIFQSGRIN